MGRKVAEIVPAIEWSVMSAPRMLSAPGQHTASSVRKCNSLRVFGLDQGSTRAQDQEVRALENQGGRHAEGNVDRGRKRGGLLTHVGGVDPVGVDGSVIVVRANTAGHGHTTLAAPWAMLILGMGHTARQAGAVHRGLVVGEPTLGGVSAGDLRSACKGGIVRRAWQIRRSEYVRQRRLLPLDPPILAALQFCQSDSHRSSRW
eukprot:3938603-Rhodomonas_salina.2